MKEEKKLIAIGFNIHGKKIEFDCKDGNLDCSGQKLTSLIIPRGVIQIDCPYNQLTELILPKGVEVVFCYNNHLNSIIIPEGVKRISCENNQLTELNLPSSMKCLEADKEVMGLDKYFGKIEIELI